MIPFDAQLLAQLRLSLVHLSARELGVALGATDEKVEERINAWRTAGFDIELRPGLGYRLLSSPDRLIADDLWSRLTPLPPFIHEIITLEETSSTNDVAARIGSAGGEALVFAERQTAGRGRFGRRWESGPCLGLSFSLVLKPSLPFALWTRLTTWAATAIAAAIEQVSRERAEIKWPNDVFLQGRKAAGILIETGVSGNCQTPFAIVGIGVNVNQAVDDFPPEIRETATSAHIAAGARVDRPALAVAILQEMNVRYTALETGFEAIISEARQRSCVIGKWIDVQSGNSRVSGIAEDLDSDGRLMIRTTDGQVAQLNAGEVTLRPPSRI